MNTTQHCKILKSAELYAHMGQTMNFMLCEFYVNKNFNEKKSGLRTQWACLGDVPSERVRGISGTGQYVASLTQERGQLSTHRTTETPLSCIRSVPTETKFRSPFVLIIRPLCSAQFCIFMWGVRSASYPYGIMKRATKLFVTERDLRVNAMGPQNLALPSANAWSYSLVGCSGVKWNPKSTWKSSIFIVVTKSDFILTSLVPLDSASFPHFTSLSLSLFF